MDKKVVSFGEVGRCKMTGISVQQDKVPDKK